MPAISRRHFLAVTSAAMAGGTGLAPYLSRVRGQQKPDVPSLLDHVLLGCSDLQKGIDFVDRPTGVRAAFGGVHPGRGTQNALLSLGERRYLEIIAPDPKQGYVEEFAVKQVVDLKQLTEPRLMGWAAHPGNLEQFATHLREAGVEFEGPRAGSRQRPDGRVLHWKTLNLSDDHRGLLPFFIEWGADSVHPSVDAPQGCTLRRFGASTPEAEDLLHTVALLGLDLSVESGDKQILQAVIAGPKGEIKVTE
jgi:catechol 2,3-dioxygenase-like lactoylglutathione lyase family enzyme